MFIPLLNYFLVFFHLFKNPDDQGLHRMAANSKRTTYFLLFSALGLLTAYLANRYYYTVLIPRFSVSTNTVYIAGIPFTTPQLQLLSELGISPARLSTWLSTVQESKVKLSLAVENVADSLIKVLQSNKDTYQDKIEELLAFAKEELPAQMNKLKKDLWSAEEFSALKEKMKKQRDDWKEWFVWAGRHYAGTVIDGARALPKRMVEYIEDIINGLMQQ